LLKDHGYVCDSLFLGGMHLKYIDLHGHYAWNIDDGIRSKEEAIEALTLAKQQGITEIVATPHIESKNISENQYQKILERIENLQKLGYQYGLKVKSGCELKLDENVDIILSKKLYIPIENTKYILCEYDLSKPIREFIEEFDGYLLEIINEGYIPIVAHIERYFYKELDIEFIKYLIELGCVIQINTTSILGLGNHEHHKNALKLIEKQLVHVIASDTHRSQGARCPNMKECYEYLYKCGYEKKYIELLMYENPNRIVNNSKIISPYFKNNKLFKNIISIKRKIRYKGL